MIPTIQIKDNFLNEKEFKILHNNIDKIYYIAMVDGDSTYGFRYCFSQDSQNKWLFEK
jgi:hypothetical protein